MTSNESCPQCDEKGSIKARAEIEKINYGVEPDVIELKVDVIVKKCNKCKFEYLDEDAQTKMHDTICRYLGVLTPTEIERIRESRHLSQQEFCSITKIAETVLNSLERGVKIQDTICDQLLYLLQIPENLDRLQQRNRRN